MLIVLFNCDWKKKDWPGSARTYLRKITYRLVVISVGAVFNSWMLTYAQKSDLSLILQLLLTCVCSFSMRQIKRGHLTITSQRNID